MQAYLERDCCGNFIQYPQSPNYYRMSPYPPGFDPNIHHGGSIQYDNPSTRQMGMNEASQGVIHRPVASYPTHMTPNIFHPPQQDPVGDDFRHDETNSVFNRYEDYPSHPLMPSVDHVSPGIRTALPLSQHDTNHAHMSPGLSRSSPTFANYLPEAMRTTPLSYPTVLDDKHSPTHSYPPLHSYSDPRRSPSTNSHKKHGKSRLYYSSDGSKTHQEHTLKDHKLDEFVDSMQKHMVQEYMDAPVNSANVSPCCSNSGSVDFMRSVSIPVSPKRIRRLSHDSSTSCESFVWSENSANSQRGSDVSAHTYRNKLCNETYKKKFVDQFGGGVKSAHESTPREWQRFLCIPATVPLLEIKEYEKIWDEKREKRKVQATAHNKKHNELLLEKVKRLKRTDQTVYENPEKTSVSTKQSTRMSHEHGLSIEQQMFNDSVIARTLADTPARIKTRNDRFRPGDCEPVSRRHQKRLVDKALVAPEGAITSKSAKMPIDDESKDYSLKADRKLRKQERLENIVKKIEKPTKTNK